MGFAAIAHVITVLNDLMYVGNVAFAKTSTCLKDMGLCEVGSLKPWGVAMDLLTRAT